MLTGGLGQNVGFALIPREDTAGENLQTWATLAGEALSVGEWESGGENFALTWVCFKQLVIFKGPNHQVPGQTGVTALLLGLDDSHLPCSTHTPGGREAFPNRCCSVD